METKPYVACKYCNTKVNEKTNSKSPCCFMMMVFNNFTGEYNSWDEIELKYYKEVGNE